MTPETNTEIPPASEPTISKRRSIIATVKGLMFTLAILASLWFALRYVLTPLVLDKEIVENPVNDSSLEDRVSALEEKLAEIALPATSEIDVSGLADRLSALEKGTAAGDAATVSATAEEITQLKVDIEKIKSEEHAYVRSILLSSQLQDAIRTGRPFEDELSALVELRPEMKKTLDLLQPHSATGIATLPQMQEQFSRAIEPALTLKGSDKSLMSNLRSLVKIRKIGESQQGKDDEAIIARAEARLKKGHVAEALKETESLSKAAATQLEPWQARAKAYLTAQTAIEKLQKSITAGEGR